MKRFNWCGYDWISQERWGQIRPSHPYQWYDPDCLNVVGDELHITAKLNPRWFDVEGKTVLSDIAIGFASCTEKFGPGLFSVDIKLPKGRNLWSAFWMWSWTGAYSEIDCVEAYTNKKGSYFQFDWRNPLAFFRLESNLHYDIAPHVHKQFGVVRKFLGFCSCLFTDEFMNFKVSYGKDCIEIYYDGKLVRRECGEKVAREFASNPMNVILNYSFNEHWQPQDVQTCTPMIAKNFKYMPYEG